MSLCHYGCGKEATNQLKNGKWCCSKHHTQCSKSKQRVSVRPKRQNSVSIENKERLLCEYGCGRDAKFQLSNKKLCCSYSYTVCVGKRTINPLSFEEENRIKKYIYLLKETDGSEIIPASDRSHSRTRKILVSCIDCGKTREVCFGDYLLSSTEFCKSCWRKGDRNPAKQNYVREKLSRKGVKDTSYVTPEWRRKASIRLSGKNNHNYGKKRKPETIKKMRLKMIERIEESIKNGGQITPQYNKNGCKIIDKYGKENGYSFQHAENGGEFYIRKLGYWVDGYDKEKNVVIEIDESFHFDVNGNLLERDIRRQKEIEETLKCKFIRIKYNKGV